MSKEQEFCPLLPTNSGYDSDDHSIGAESIVVLCSNLMNGDQALELKELERDYELFLMRTAGFLFGTSKWFWKMGMKTY